MVEKCTQESQETYQSKIKGILSFHTGSDILTNLGIEMHESKHVTERQELIRQLDDLKNKLETMSEQAIESPTQSLIDLNIHTNCNGLSVPI
jgi:hypothetical protein